MVLLLYLIGRLRTSSEDDGQTVIFRDKAQKRGCQELEEIGW